MLAEDIGILYIRPEDIKRSVCAVPRELVPGFISKRHKILNRESGVLRHVLFGSSTKPTACDSNMYKYVLLANTKITLLYHKSRGNPFDD